ncbi:MAG: DUF5916 domain-containing protein [Bacteroidota bacterium]
MLTKPIALLSLSTLFSLQLFAQSPTPAPKKIAAKRTEAAIKLDGLLDDAAWKDAPAALDYTEFRPTPFRKEDTANRTEVYMLYNDEGIYLGGYCYERTKDSISSELTGRDGFGNNDFIGFIFDTYNDKINGFEYFITPLGEQMDAKMSPNPNGNSEDFSWNAVWKSYAVIHDDGWSFEIFLPFSAIRFSKKTVQDWGLNITRRRQKTQQQVTWNPIDVNVNGFLTQEGFWTGLENIKPPLRLQFSPYLSTYVNHYPLNEPGQKNWTSGVNGGMDVKYGISQALTLDMTLVPDFGQVQSDNQVLNLTPFEVKFNENRSFFTEGTELFNKGNYFYSRRVGGTPIHLYDVEGQLNSNEHIIKNPTETRLLNATKVSGRLQNGLGIGVFNAVTNAQYATVGDDAGHDRKIQTSPLTNYNIIVLNQSMKHNSSISLVNTNVWRSGNDYDADVTAGLFDFFDKKNMWNVGGKVATSNLVNILPGGKTQSGYSHLVYFGKASGRFNFNLQQELTNDKFNSNDLGYFTFNNFMDHSLWAGYRWTKPGKFYNNIYLNLNAYYSRRVTPGAYRSSNFNANVNGQLKNLWYVGFLAGLEPKYNDFNEPRREGRVFKGWSDYFFDIWFQTNNAKKYNAYAEILYVARSMFESKRYAFFSNQRYRFNNKFSISYGLNMEPQTNNVGFASFDPPNQPLTGDIIFGRRNRNTIENILSFKYNFNDKMGLNTRVRHYWSKVDYKEFFTLLQSGELEKNTTFNQNVNQNVNFFNVDMTYTWQFAPGSFINVVWKNSVVDFKDQIEKNYIKNFNKTMEADQNNNISFKIIYFLDALQLKKKKKV